jgi:hypothetical protein
MAFALAAQPAPEFVRETPKTGMVLAVQDGNLLVGRMGRESARLFLEDREGNLVREFELKPNSGSGTRVRLTTAAVTAGDIPVASAVSMDANRHAVENLVYFGAERKPVATGEFSCQAMAAANSETAWCLGAYSGGGEKQRSLLYRVTSEGAVSAHYALPTAQDHRTAEGLSRFPALGFPGIWATADGAVWAWLPGDRKMIRFRPESGRLEAWDVPLPKGGPAGVSVAVTPGGSVIAMLPVSQDGWRVAPGPSPVFSVFSLEQKTGTWKKLEGLPPFKRGARLMGAGERSIIIERPDEVRLEWWRAGGE